MKTIFNLTIAKLLLTLVCFNANAQPQGFSDSCSEVLRISSRDVEARYKKANIAKYVYENYCEGSNVKSGLNLNIGVEDLLESFDLGFGSTKEKVKNICQTYENKYKESVVETSYSSRTVREAISAWLECKKLSNNGVLVRPIVQKTRATIDFLKTGPDDVVINGVKYDTKLLKCEASIGGGLLTDPSVKEVNSRTIHTISDTDVWSISCERIPESQDGVKFYHETDLTVLSSKGSIKLTLPADEKIPFNWSSEMNEKLAELTSNFNKQIGALKVSAVDKEKPIRIYSPRISTANTTKCPKGYAIVEIKVAQGVGGRYAVDAIRSLDVTCQKISLIKE